MLHVCTGMHNNFGNKITHCRVRIPYLQLKEATLLAQALFRGRKARSMVPRLKKEKAQRDVRRAVHLI